MKRTFWTAVCFCLATAAGWSAVPHPVYIFLTTTVSDHINADMSEDRLRRILPLLEKYRAQNPTLAETILFSGAMSEALEKQNGNNHLLDYVRSYVNRGIIEAGYDGTDEPTYKNRPMLDFRQALTSADRWFVRAATAEKLLSVGRDPLTGELRPGTPGGLVKMQQALGPAAYIKGVVLQTPNIYGPIADAGFDTEIVNEIRRFNTTAVLQGIDNFNSGHVGSDNYLGWKIAIGKSLSPDEDDSPELFWRDNMLRTSEASGADIVVFPAENGLAAFKDVVAKLDRSRTRILHVELGNVSLHARPLPQPLRPNVPLQYAYDHPEHPQYPAEMRLSPAEVDEGYRKQEAFLQYLIGDFFPANAGSRFVSAGDLRRMTPPGWGYDLQMSSLRPALEKMMKAWGDDKVPPRFLRVEDHYLSQADMFGVLVDALTQVSRTGRLPATVHVSRVFGPVETIQPRIPATGQVPVDAVIRRATVLAETLRDDAQHERTWTPMPLNAVPAAVMVGGLTVNPAQFLRLMAETLLAPESGATLTAKPTDLFWGREPVFVNRRSSSDLGAGWTYKPAAIQPSK